MDKRRDLRERVLLRDTEDKLRMMVTSIGEEHKGVSTYTLFKVETSNCYLKAVSFSIKLVFFFFFFVCRQTINRIRNKFLFT